MHAHPYADAFPLVDEVVAELAESIAANGLRSPVVTTPDGLILDGRHRAAACARLGIQPETVEYGGDDLAEYVIDCNATRRNLSTGQRAASVALVLAGDGRRENGRWRRGSVDVSNTESRNTWQDALRQAGVVLDYLGTDGLREVVDGTTTLNANYEQADDMRRSEQADALAEKARKKREADEAKAAAERDAAIIADLVGTKYELLIADGTMTPLAAQAAHFSDTDKERRAAADREHSRQSACLRVAEHVRMLAAEQPQKFVEDYYPHEAKYVAEGMRLTAERVDQAIDLLTAIRKAIQ